MSSKLRSPIWWFGGKGNMVAKLLKYVPCHHTYVEVFGGGASLLMRKPPAPVEVYNDIDSRLVNLFRVLRDPDQCAELQRRLVLTPYSRQEYREARTIIEGDAVTLAHAFYTEIRQSFSGHNGWSYSVTMSRRGMVSTSSKWLSTIDMLPDIHDRLFRCQIEHDDFRRIIPRYDTPNTFFYLDPPYIAATRRSGGYNHEMTDADHSDLVDIVSNAKGMVLLSGYLHPVYEALECIGWRRDDYVTACHAAAKTRPTGIQGKGVSMAKQPRTESLWLNPQLQEALNETSDIRNNAADVVSA
jgi:DNA adenine methylase